MMRLTVITDEASWYMSGARESPLPIPSNVDGRQALQEPRSERCRTRPIGSRERERERKSSINWSCSNQVSLFSHGSARFTPIAPRRSTCRRVKQNRGVAEAPAEEPRSPDEANNQEPCRSVVVGCLTLVTSVKSSFGIWCTSLMRQD